MSTSDTSNLSNIEEIDITPDISLMPKLAFTGYSAPQAVGELVDNAIDSRLDNGQLLKVSINIKEDSVSVADNGSGMNKEIASKALVLAFSQKRGKLGEFGLGLKTACLSLGDYFEVITSSEGDPNEYHIYFDRKKWEISTKGWKVPFERRHSERNDHFTVISIKKLKVFYPNLHNYIRDDLKKRYAPFIRAKQVDIKVNGKRCEPEDLVLIEGSKREFNIPLSVGNRIYGWYGLLKEGSQKGYYGFSTFRRGRMITTYDKIGFESHPSVARLVGEVHLDHLQPTHNKREFVKDANYQDAETALRKELVDILRQARKKATQDTVTEKNQREVDIWIDKISESLRSEEFKSYTSRLKNIEPVPDLNGEETREIDIEKRTPRGEKDTKQGQVLNERARTPKQTHKRKRHIVRVKGKNIEFTHAFAPMGTNEPWWTHSYTEEKGLEIFTNTEFPAYLATNDKVFYAVIHIAEAISEFLVEKAQEKLANADELKQLILRKASELKSQL